MFLERIKSEGIAHLSYIIGDGDDAAVIDPRRDCQIYIDIAAQNETRISHIFETHRNEDYLIGSVDLSERTGAAIYHGSALDFSYGNSLSDGDTFEIGDLLLRVLETPGHTFESISLTVIDTNFGDTPIGVFTGDTLFIGDVGRTDFYPDRAEEAAEALYYSLFDKLLKLGDQTILYPAHGAGSVCGDNMASREFSTIGFELLNNPVLKKTDPEKFIAFKLSEHHEKPPYFKKMEHYNQHGPPPLDKLPTAPPMSVEDAASACREGSLVIDLRSPAAFAGAFIPDSLAIPLEMIPAYSGYLIDYDQDIILVADEHRQVETAVKYLFRIGYDRICGYLKGGVKSWYVSGRSYDNINAVHAADIDARLQNREGFTLLDVRKRSEYRNSRLEGSVHIFLGDLQNRIDELDRSKPVVTFCGSGMRAIIAASILKRHDFTRVENSLGSMQACTAVGCKTLTG